MTKTEDLLYTLIQKINKLKIAGYIKEEVNSSLKYLHWYKLKNIEKNFSLFCEYLIFLNMQNTDKINQFKTNIFKQNIQGKNRDLSYFLVIEKKISKKAEKEYFQKITNNRYELLTLIQGFKGLLILTIDEFCNASQTRMGIHKLLMERNSEYRSLLIKNY